MESVCSVSPVYAVGDPVKAQYHNGKWYAASIAEAVADGSFVVDWTDGTRKDRVKYAYELRDADGKSRVGYVADTDVGTPKAAVKTVACVGDSLTEGGYPAYLQDCFAEAVARKAATARCWRVLDFGVSGSTAIRVGPCAQPFASTSQLHEAIRSRADVVVLLLGTNDSKLGVWQETSFCQDYSALLRQLLEGDAQPRFAAPPAVIAVVPPPLCRDLAFGCMQQFVVNGILPELIPRLAGKLNVSVVDAFSAMGGCALAVPPMAFDDDGCHLTAEGDRLLAEIIADEVLREVERVPPGEDTAADEWESVD